MRKTSSQYNTNTHLVIPDTQIKPGTSYQHIISLAKYICAKKPNVVVMLGDWWDMPSLSSYEKKGSKILEGKRIHEDIKAGNDVMIKFMDIIKQGIGRQRGRNRWSPRLVFLLGNHEHRIDRYVNENPQHEGLIDKSLLHLDGWEVYDYQVPVMIDGIAYCHNFVNPESLVKSVVTGSIENKIKLLKQSFTMGHQQRRQFGQSYNALGGEIMGLVVGRFYEHDEHYMGPQGQSDWSGIVMKHEVENGRYDPSFVSMRYLLENYK